jgi:hypothetical protein
MFMKKSFQLVDNIRKQGLMDEFYWGSCTLDIKQKYSDLRAYS